MPSNALLTALSARRPLLMEPVAAGEMTQRFRALDERGRPSAFQSLLRRVGLATAMPVAMVSDEPAAPLAERLAYAPLWAGDVEDTGYCWSLLDGVALMSVDGPLFDHGEEWWGWVFHGYDTIKAGIADAMADDRVKAVFLRLDSPGGVVSGGLADLAGFIREVRATGNDGGKPIWVYADMACSAAYWIAAQADRVIAPKVGLVGSIGAVIVHTNLAGLLEKEGVEVTSIQFGANKTDGAWWKALSPAAIADLTAEIDQCGRDFCADVAAGRPKLTPEALIATQARVFMAQHDEDARSGLALGFVDAIASEEDAFEALLAEISAPKGKTTHANPGKEAVMANPNRAARRAGASKRAAATAATARPAAAAPDPGYVDCDTCDGSGKNADGSDCEDCDGDGQVPVDDEDMNGHVHRAPAANHATAISASPEAKTHPHLALAAIGSGMTLAQFKATVDAAGPAMKPGSSRVLDTVQAHAVRLGPDATGVDDNKGLAPAGATLDPVAIYASRRAQTRAARRAGGRG